MIRTQQKECNISDSLWCATTLFLNIKVYENGVCKWVILGTSLQYNYFWIYIQLNITFPSYIVFHFFHSTWVLSISFELELHSRGHKLTLMSNQHTYRCRFFIDISLSLVVFVSLPVLLNCIGFSRVLNTAANPRKPKTTISLSSKISIKNLIGFHLKA